MKKGLFGAVFPVDTEPRDTGESEETSVKSINVSHRCIGRQYLSLPCQME